MIKLSRSIMGVAAASLAFIAVSAGAQGKSQDKGNKGKGHDKGKVERIDVRDRDHDGDRDRDRDRIRNDVRIRNDPGYDRDVYVDGRRVPPGLAKKPGGMPPGQYKKRYGTTQGVTVLSDILGQRGYTVIRTVPAGESRYVYYRASDRTVRRAIVSPGREQLTFTNVPADLLREVLARLR